MARRQTAIIFPHLNDCGGDLTKQWYVEWKYRIPGVEGLKKEREYKRLNLPTAKERYKEAQLIIEEKRKWLEAGEHLNPYSKKKTYEDELLYQAEKRTYGKMRDSVSTVRIYMSEFIRYKQSHINSRTKGTYVSKMRLFDNWLEVNNLHTIDVANINRGHIIQFITDISTRDNLSRATCSKQIQILYSFFNWLELEKNLVQKNPCLKIPRMGVIVDCAPVPIHLDDRATLQAAIEKQSPQLWLACQFQFYCAIRPGIELRLLKIKWIDFNKEELRIPNVEAKNNDSEVVKIPKLLMNELLKYHINTYDKELYLFGKNGMPGTEPLGKNTMRNRFNQFRDQLKLSSQYKYYSWKHSGAVTASENGMLPYQLKEHLRHKSITTTEKYIRKKSGSYIKDIDNFF